MVWPSGEPRGRQWPHCVAEVPLVSVTLPATETGRSKMAEHRESPAGACHALNGVVLILFGCGSASGES